MSHLRPSLLPGLLQAAARNSATGNGRYGRCLSSARYLLAVSLRMKKSCSAGYWSGMAARAIPTRDDGWWMFMMQRPMSRRFYRQSVRQPNRWFCAERPIGGIQGGRVNWLWGQRILCVPLAKFTPRILADFGLKTAVVGFALHLDRVPFSTAKTKTRPALHLTDLQAIERDFAFYRG